MCVHSILIAQTEERRMIDDFDELSVTGLIEVELMQGDKPGITIISEGITMDKIVTENDGRRLKISMKPGFYRDVHVAVKLTYTYLSSIRLQAGAALYSAYIIHSDRLEIRAGSGSKIDAELDVASVSIKVGEGSRAILSGNATYEEARIGTGGQLYADELLAEQINIRISTGAEAEVYAKRSVEGKVNTGGDLAIYGNPRADYVKTSLGGSVRRIRP